MQDNAVEPVQNLSDLELSIKVRVDHKGRTLAPVVILEERVRAKRERSKWWRHSVA